MSGEQRVAPSAAKLIEHYIKLRDHVKAQGDAFEQLMKPYKEGMSSIEGELLRIMNEQFGAETDKGNLACDAGTAYRTTHTTVKVTDRDAFVQHVMEHWTTWGKEMLLAQAQKDAVKEYLAEAGEPPDGVEVSHFTKVNIRRA